MNFYSIFWSFAFFGLLILFIGMIIGFSLGSNDGDRVIKTGYFIQNEKLYKVTEENKSEGNL